MKPHTINSSVVRLVHYDPTNGLLELEYHNGTSRRWFGVPVRVYHTLCSAKDPDAFFRTFINQYYTSLRGKISF
ncbi:MAG: KTSC domain-containing protein [Pantoea ananatis]|jgi:hypothetical protein|uniref:KTSC domain-containing protein n=1 Tax=Pantoea TaxID=53335 RepID=UPI000CF408EB|nr:MULTISPECIES: KTSC domain-containing protein [Pantoea]MBA4824037.1 KTSC domain-containing protein [Pantoea ananatis]MCS4493442.1 KTSC domain-containing protein [Pantoea sp. B623]MCW1834762.1 KTSC domain-containing protein [Pantoea ananatis]NEK81280.1 KTSC domain-containing protein [Pantoea ananatis]PQK74256.1 KTSC domain-containing protein [Pantoea ananatis]